MDDLSSAHVYLRLPRGESWEEVPQGVLEDCVQLVKANSIQGTTHARNDDDKEKKTEGSISSCDDGFFQDAS